MNTRFLDDLIVGDRFISGGLTLTEAEIIDFAFRYDPQPFHLDAVAAAESPYGGLIASGFQSLALCFRLFIQSGVLAGSSMGSPGIDELRWLAPVRPGDTLHSEVEVLEVRPSSSKPDRGIARLQYKALNQRGEAVLSFIVAHLLKRRAT
ncbi:MULTISPECIES: MaoC family dehydratase [Zoogloea]|uniref:MaoC family dehydratase n=1 Tax=Zoogloea oleivorans TaxID=1552750 RepID=A0A6C2CJF4_9RHOO|nr:MULTISPECIES: MaoC family dehydratase [Zoogloea]MBT9498791.1 MaoC family dehydratase [Zoogloea sp.]MDD2667669.1 MaoC family dehydratase [Zoogloea sp.]TYC53375.1 MaoC family dehydratase [Zoogloea oleivorans]